MAQVQFAGDESATFGLNIWRADATVDAISLLTCSPAADIVVVRDTVARLQNCPILVQKAFDAELRDHILSFKKELRSDNPMAPTGIECNVEKPTSADWSEISAICAENFTDYPGHYQQSPYLERSRAAAGMESWLAKLLQSDAEGVFVVRQSGHVVGVMGYAYSENTAELAIAAISKSVGVRQRNLLLVEATRRVEHRLRERQMRFFVAKTQATNTSIQRNLVRYVGCEPAVVSATVHVNLFLEKLSSEGEDISLIETLPTTVLAYGDRFARGGENRRLHAYHVVDSAVERIRVVHLKRYDGITALHFGGYDAAGRVCSVASFFCG